MASTRVNLKPSWSPDPRGGIGPYPRPHRSEPALRPMTEQERAARPRLLQLDDDRSVPVTEGNVRRWLALARLGGRAGNRGHRSSIYPVPGECGTDDDDGS